MELKKCSFLLISSCHVVVMMDNVLNNSPTRSARSCKRDDNGRHADDCFVDSALTAWLPTPTGPILLEAEWVMMCERWRVRWYGWEMRCKIVCVMVSNGMWDGDSYNEKK